MRSRVLLELSGTRCRWRPFWRMVCGECCEGGGGVECGRWRSVARVMRCKDRMESDTSLRMWEIITMAGGYQRVYSMM